MVSPDERISAALARDIVVRRSAAYCETMRALRETEDSAEHERLGAAAARIMAMLEQADVMRNFFETPLGHAHTLSSFMDYMGVSSSGVGS